MEKLVMDISIKIPEAKTKLELRNFVRNILVTGSQYTLIDYQIINFKIRKEKI